MTRAKTWRPWTSDEDEIVVSLPPRQAVAKLPHRTIESIYQRRWVKGNGRGRQYKPTGQRRIPPKVERYIRAMFGKVPVTELAEKTGLSRQTVYNVMRREPS